MDNKGTILCIISLLCMFLAPFVFFAVSLNFMSGDISGSTASAYSVMTVLDVMAYIAAWVLAIISRAKYKNKFSLVLIIIYASLLGLAFIWGILMVCILLAAF